MSEGDVGAYYHDAKSGCPCNERGWQPVFRKKAWTEILKLEEFQEWVLNELFRLQRGNVVTVIQLLCNDNATIAAARKMEEGSG